MLGGMDVPAPQRSRPANRVLPNWGGRLFARGAQQQAGQGVTLRAAVEKGQRVVCAKHAQEYSRFRPRLQGRPDGPQNGWRAAPCLRLAHMT